MKNTYWKINIFYFSNIFKIYLSDYDTNLKIISNNINGYLIHLISNYALIKGIKDTSLNNSNMKTTKFLNKYSKIIKLQK
jgi:hypothetical protein